MAHTQMMKALPQLPIMLLILLTGMPLAAHAAEDDEDMGSDCTYHRPDFKERSIPKFQHAGEVTLAGGLKIPAYSLSMTSGALNEGELQTYTPKEPYPNIKLKPELASQLDAYATPMGMVLIPRGWKPIDAAENFDGRLYIAFAPDTSGQSYLSIESAGACMGCAYGDASLYFANARKYARENAFSYCRASRAVHSVSLNPTQKAYRIDVTEGNPVNGLAHFNADDQYFYDVRISVPAAQHALASVILNQFVLSKKSK